MCRYELTTCWQNFTEIHLTSVKISQNVLGGILFFDSHCRYTMMVTDVFRWWTLDSDDKLTDNCGLSRRRDGSHHLEWDLRVVTENKWTDTGRPFADTDANHPRITRDVTKFEFDNVQTSNVFNRFEI